jgi:hypothetical protein
MGVDKPPCNIWKIAEYPVNTGVQKNALMQRCKVFESAFQAVCPQRIGVY